MSKKIIIISTLISMLVITGCATGNKTNNPLENMTQAQTAEYLVSGETTKEEVRTQLGDPHYVDLEPGGNEKWTYIYMELSYSGFLNTTRDITTRQLVILFDEDDVVVNHVFNNNLNEIRNY